MTTARGAPIRQGAPGGPQLSHWRDKVIGCQLRTHLRQRTHTRTQNRRTKQPVYSIYRNQPAISAIYKPSAPSRSASVHSIDLRASSAVADPIADRPILRHGQATLLQLAFLAAKQSSRRVCPCRLPNTFVARQPFAVFCPLRRAAALGQSAPL